MTTLTLERPVDLFVETTSASPRVLLVEAHRMVGEMMQANLRARGMDAALSACISAEAILAEARVLRPELVILDLELADAGSGLDLIRPLTDLGATVLVLSGVGDRVQLARCLEAGAVGVVSKAEPFLSVLDKIGRAAQGEAITPLNDRVQYLSELQRHRRETESKRVPFEALSRREREVLSLMVDGRAAAEIARQSFVSLATVRTQIRSVLQKLGVNSQMAAVALTRNYRVGARGMKLRVRDQTEKSAEAGHAGDRDFEVRADGSRFGELLMRMRLVDIGALVEALQQQSITGRRLGAILVEAGQLSERDLAAALAEHLHMPMADLRKDRPDPEAVKLVPEHVARELVVVPLRLDGKTLELAAADPTPQLESQLREVTSGAIRLLIAPASEVSRVIDATYRALGAIEAQIKAFGATDALRRSTAAPSQPASTTTQGDAPVVQVVNLLIAQALRDRASDIHIEPQDGEVRIRFRVDGALHDVTRIPGEMAPALVSRIKIMAGMNIVERRRPQDGQTSLEVDGRALDVRVAATPTVFGEKITLRLLDKSRPLFKGADLGMPPDTHEAWTKLVRSPFGMVVCVGPTGSGKTTSLYATLSELNSVERNIMTIEDPVEYVLPSINQIQINEQAGVTFAEGLRSILRQDPDVILVGEIRDAETARIAVQAALTGHLVLSSLHATDTAAAVHRFLDMGIEAFLVASSALAFVGQRLVRRMCSTCQVPYTPTEEELSFYLESGGPPKEKFFVGEGCNLCSGTGYQDRIGVYELLRVTPEIKRLIVGWATQEEVRRMAIAQGMRTLLQEGLNLVASDTTTISEIIRVIYAS